MTIVTSALNGNTADVTNDAVSRPPHYTAYGVEVIDLTEHMNFCRGNVVKYICRAGLKPTADELEDLRKAQWYLNRGIARVERQREGMKKPSEGEGFNR